MDIFVALINLAILCTPLLVIAKILQRQRNKQRKKRIAFLNTPNPHYGKVSPLTVYPYRPPSYKPPMSQSMPNERHREVVHQFESESVDFYDSEGRYIDSTILTRDGGTIEFKKKFIHNQLIDK